MSTFMLPRMIPDDVDGELRPEDHATIIRNIVSDLNGAIRAASNVGVHVKMNVVPPDGTRGDREWLRIGAITREVQL